MLEQKEELLRSDTDDEGTPLKDLEFKMENLQALHGKLKEIELKTHVGNKLIKALVTKNRDQYSVDQGE